MRFFRPKAWAPFFETDYGTGMKKEGPVTHIGVDKGPGSGGHWWKFARKEKSIAII
jgi:hypothetical protein